MPQVISDGVKTRRGRAKGAPKAEAREREKREPREPRAARERESNLPLGGVCVNCHVHLASQDADAVTHPIIKTTSHGRCMRVIGIPFVAKALKALVASCELEVKSKRGEEIRFSETLKDRLSAEALRKMTVEGLAAIVTEMLDLLYVRSTNGLSGLKPGIVKMARTARDRLLCEVSPAIVKAADEADAKAKAEADEAAKKAVETAAPVQAEPPAATQPRESQPQQVASSARGKIDKSPKPKKK